MTMKTIASAMAGLITTVALVGASYFGIKAAHGDFDDYYYVSADVPRAGQQLEVGVDVRVRGVNIGEVSGIRLVGDHPEITMRIPVRYRIPQTAKATIALKTLLGEKYIDLRYDPHATGPFLADGDTIANTEVGPEVEDALADGVSVLKAIKPGDAATIISELATGARGHGDDIARGFRANSELSATFAGTMRYQLEAIHDFRTVFGALKEKGVDLNLLAKAVNQGVPVYASNSAARNLRRALTALLPFSDNLGDLLIVKRKQWDTMIDAGDRVLGVLASDPRGVHDFVRGLHHYVYKLGGAQRGNVLPDGSSTAGFTNFIGGDDSSMSHNQICWALPADVRPQVPVCAEGAK